MIDEIIKNNYYLLLLCTLYLILFFYVILKIKSSFKDETQIVYSHPFNQWWLRKETNISPWYQDHLFDEKRNDNLFPSYQNI